MEEGEVIEQERVEVDDPVFDFPFMGGESAEEQEEGEVSISRERENHRPQMPEARQYHQDGEHFGGEQFGGASWVENNRNATGFGLGYQFPSSTPHSYWGPQYMGGQDYRSKGFGGGEGYQPRQEIAVAEQAPREGLMGQLRPQSEQPKAKLGGFNAPAPLEKGIMQSEKYERWLKWKTTFDVALLICDGEPSDTQKTGLLYTYVGDETRDIINMLSLPPMHGDRTCRDGQYAELSKGLNLYFRTLVDETTDFARYNARKQVQGESVHQFALKLRDLAIRVGVSHDSIAFRHQFLAGLTNRELAKKATEDGSPISTVIQQAGRIEQATEVNEAKPWLDPGHQLAVIAAVSSKRGWKREPEARDRGKRSRLEGSNERQSKW